MLVFIEYTIWDLQYNVDYPIWELQSNIGIYRLSNIGITIQCWYLWIIRYEN